MQGTTIMGLGLLLVILAALITLARRGKVAKTSAIHRPPGASPSASVRKTMSVSESQPTSPTASDRGPVPPTLAAFTLLQSDTLPAQTLAELAPLASSLGQPHPLLGRLSSGLDDAESLAEIVRSDPVLSAEVLRRVNSPAFGLSTPIASVQYALTFLGSNFVRQVVLHAAVAPSVRLETPDQQTAADRLWQASYVASSYAQLAAQHHGLSRPSVLATQALLACLGDVVVLAARPDLAPNYLSEATLFERVDAQQTELSANAGQLAAWLAQQWQLPDELIQGLKHSLLPLALPPEAHPLTGDALRSNLLAYTAGIVGQRVVRDQLTELASLDLAADPGLDCYYLPAHLEAAGLGTLLRFHQNPAVLQKLKPLLNSLLR